MKYYSIEFKERSGGKLRIFNNPSSELRNLINETSEKLRVLFPELKSPSRTAQSLRDIEAYKIFYYVHFMDVQQALLRGNVVIIAIYLMLISPRSIFLLPNILKIYFAEVRNDKGEIVKGRSNSMKGGFRTSSELLELCFQSHLKFFNRHLGFGQLYVDDVVLFSDNLFCLRIFIVLMKIHFSILGFKFHKCEQYSLREKPRKCGQRLGLLFGFRNGMLITQVRAKALRKYLGRIKSMAYSKNSSRAFQKISHALYGAIDPPAYPLYATFDRRIWLDSIQRNKFFSQVVNVLKRRFPELRKLNKEKIASFLWGHSYI